MSNYKCCIRTLDHLFILLNFCAACPRLAVSLIRSKLPLRCGVQAVRVLVFWVNMYTTVSMKKEDVEE